MKILVSERRRLFTPEVASVVAVSSLRRMRETPEITSVAAMSRSRCSWENSENKSVVAVRLNRRECAARGILVLSVLLVLGPLGPLGRRRLTLNDSEPPRQVGPICLALTGSAHRPCRVVAFFLAGGFSDLSGIRRQCT